MVKIVIDDQELEVPQGAMIIEAADKAGIPIPRFCYHKKLSIAANCRMCLVDVDNVGKPLPACATPVSEGMKVHTQTKKALDAQKAVMEFLLINHPLDCPICDQGGQCELQDVALEYGQSYSQFTERKRVVKDQDLGSLIATDMTRCIHCTRCVRFGKEIAGVQELGATGRGEHMEIGTYVEQSVNSELSGNVIDLCPVGALTSKPFRYSARAWELYRQPGVSLHDGLGSNLYYHVHNSKVMRVGPRENEILNEVWLSDRDRFSYEGFTSPDRLGAPEMKVDGKWQVVDWHTALTQAAADLGENPEELGVLASPSATLEELYLLQKLFREKGCAHLDHRIHQNDFIENEATVAALGFEVRLPELQTQDVIVVIGSLLQHESPLVAHRVRQASLSGAKVCLLGPIGLDYTFTPAVEWIALDLVNALACVLKVFTPEAPFLGNVEITEEAKQLAAVLRDAKSTSIILGQWVETHPQRSTLHYLARQLAEQTKANLNVLTFGSNSRGAKLVGMLPSEKGLSAKGMFDKPRQAYLLHNIEPELDCADPANAMRALFKAKAVVMITPYVTDTMRQYATVLLPSVPASETSGTYVNFFGDWQSVRAAVKPYQEARPAWKIFRVLGNLFNLSGFEYQSSEDVLAEIKAFRTPEVAKQKVESLARFKSPKQDEYFRLAPRSLYAVDNVVRRSAPLQATAHAQMAKQIRLHPDSLAALKLKDGDTVKIEQSGNLSESLGVVSDERVPLQAAVVSVALPEVGTLGPGFSNIRIIANVA